ncbi:MAG: NUDIX domain-containing protein [Myxococcales bacterium]|nr:NUDIX domain-containing protein [Myxococcales bacterium]
MTSHAGVVSNPPGKSGDQPLVRVIACVLERGNRMLVGMRPDNKRHGGLWEFPGGKLEPGEGDLEAAARELDEELGIDVYAVDRVMAELHDEGSVYNIVFRRVRARGEPEAFEHSELKWATLHELEKMPLAPTDAQFVRMQLA